MFHPDPEAHQIQQQLHLANSCYMMVSKKKIVDDGQIQKCFPKGRWFFEKFHNPCRKH